MMEEEEEEFIRQTSDDVRAELPRPVYQQQLFNVNMPVLTPSALEAGGKALTKQ